MNKWIMSICRSRIDPVFLKGDTHGKQGTKRQEGKEKKEEREAKGDRQKVIG
jgi:hypothetical protein